MQGGKHKYVTHLAKRTVDSICPDIKFNGKTQPGPMIVVCGYGRGGPLSTTTNTLWRLRWLLLQRWQSRGEAAAAVVVVVGVQPEQSARARDQNGLTTERRPGSKRPAGTSYACTRDHWRRIACVRVLTFTVLLAYPLLLLVLLLLLLLLLLGVIRLLIEFPSWAVAAAMVEGVWEEEQRGKRESRYVAPPILPVERRGNVDGRRIGVKRRTTVENVPRARRTHKRIGHDADWYCEGDGPA